MSNKQQRQDLIEITKIGGIKCDTPWCDYRDESVLVEDYPNWLNRPCPKCGANLLTKADYKSCKKILAIVNVINKIGRILPKKMYNKLTEQPRAVGTIDWDGSGSGNLSINVEEKEE